MELHAPTNRLLVRASAYLASKEKYYKKKMASNNLALIEKAMKMKHSTTEHGKRNPCDHRPDSWPQL